jgi:quercetin dioxygenase-like cupin family protein
LRFSGNRDLINPSAARAVSSTKLKELGFNPVCMEPGAENPGHSHTLVEEILIVQRGTGKIQIENEIFDLCAGSVAIVPAGGSTHCVRLSRKTSNQKLMKTTKKLKQK